MLNYTPFLSKGQKKDHLYFVSKQATKYQIHFCALDCKTRLRASSFLGFSIPTTESSLTSIAEAPYPPHNWKGKQPFRRSVGWGYWSWYKISNARERHATPEKRGRLFSLLPCMVFETFQDKPQHGGHRVISGSKLESLCSSPSTKRSSAFRFS